MYGETLVIILPFAFFCWDDIISVRCVVVWVAIWIKPIERFLFHASRKAIELGKKKNFYGVRNTFKSNLPAWITPRRGIFIKHMHGRVEPLTLCSSTYFECQFYLWKHFSIISNANKICPRTSDIWRHYRIITIKLAHHPIEPRNILTFHRLFPSQSGLLISQHVPSVNTFRFCSRINSKIENTAWNFILKFPSCVPHFRILFCTATACRRFLKESQSIPLSALLSLYSSEWLIIIERFCELPIVLKLKRFLLSSKPPGDGLKVKIFARVLFLEDTQHLMIASVPQSWLWCSFACFVQRFSLTGCLRVWFQVISEAANCSENLMKVLQRCRRKNLSNLHFTADLYSLPPYEEGFHSPGTPSMLRRSTKAL